MPLSSEKRRKDKGDLYPNRIPKFYLSEAQVKEVKKKYPTIKIEKLKGSPYIVLWDFPSCAFLKLEEEKQTKQNLAFSLLKFLQWKEALPDDLIAEYRKNRERAAADLAAFIAEHRTHYSSSYLQKIEWAVRTWLYVNGVELPGEVLRKRYRIRFKMGRIGDQPPTRDELRRILLEASKHWRAFFSLLSATGLRPAEALTLRIGDLKPHPYDASDSEEVITVAVPETLAKKDFSYVTFAHPECAKLLSEYLRDLEERGIDVEAPDQPLFYNWRIGGFYKVNTAEVAWNKILRKLGLDEKIEYPGRYYYLRRLYSLRKFFRTNLEAAGVPYGAVEAMLGHKNWYVRFSKERLKKYYEKGMWALMVLTVPGPERIEEIVEKRIRPLEAELKKLRREREEERLRKEAEARELLEKLYRLLQRHPELLKELEEGES